MNKKLLLIPAVITATLVGSIGFIGMQEASAHQSMSTDFGRIIIGHEGEPSFGHEKGVWLGKHPAEVILRDSSDEPISGQGYDKETGEGLRIDKYFFKNVKKYNKADSLDDATAISLNNQLNEVRGEAGTYHSDQIIDDGIYGYRVHGTVNGESIEVTLFCNHPDMDDPKKFENGPNEPSENDFGCPRDISGIKFPPENNKKHDD